MEFVSARVWSFVAVASTIWVSFADAQGWIVEDPRDNAEAREKYDVNADRICRIDVASADQTIRFQRADSTCDNSVGEVSDVRGRIAGVQNLIDQLKRNAKTTTDRRSQETIAAKLEQARSEIKEERRAYTAAEQARAACFQGVADGALEVEFDADKACKSSWTTDSSGPDSSCVALARRTADTIVAKRQNAAKTRPLDELIRIPRGKRLPAEQLRISDAVQKCRDQVAVRISERQAAAASRPFAEIEAIPDAYRIPEEKERISADIAERRAVIVARQQDKKWMAPVLSAALCAYASDKNELASEIRTERAYAKKYGGVFDVGKIYSLQQQIRAFDESSTETRASLRKLRASAQGCGNKLVKVLAKCLYFGPDHTEDRPASCKTDEIRSYDDLTGAVPFIAVDE